MPRAPAPLSLTRLRSVPPRLACPPPLLLTCAPATRRTETLMPRPPPAHPLPPSCRAPDSDDPADASPPAFASATTRPSSGILDTKRAPTLTPRLVTHLLHALTLSAAHPLRPDTDRSVSSISHC
jgi:hypothetical protein